MTESKIKFTIIWCVYCICYETWWRSRAIFKFLFILLSGATTSSDRQKNHCNITSDKGLSDDIWLMNMTSSMTSQSNCNLLQFLMSFSRNSAHTHQPTTIILAWKWSQEQGGSYQTQIKKSGDFRPKNYRSRQYVSHIICDILQFI